MLNAADMSTTTGEKEAQRVQRAQRAQRAQTTYPCDIQQGATEAQKGAKLELERPMLPPRPAVRPNAPNLRPSISRADATVAPDAPPAPVFPEGESPNPWMTERQFRQAHAVTWSNEQIQGYLDHHQNARSMGASAVAAEHWAELATWRDISGDDRRACIECRRYRHNWGGTWGVCELPFNPALLATGKQEFFRLRRCDSYKERKLHD